MSPSLSVPERGEKFTIKNCENPALDGEWQVVDVCKPEQKNLGLEISVVVERTSRNIVRLAV